MGKIRGFLLKHRVSTLFRSIIRWHRSRARYRRLGLHGAWRRGPFSKLISWTYRLKTKARAIISSKSLIIGSGPTQGYMRVGQEPFQDKPVTVPKGYLAVYVGQKGGDFQRILVPVVYFNHPLFGELLREAEQEYGYDHQGGITIPCPISVFERVETRIKAGQCTRKLWRRSNKSL